MTIRIIELPLDFGASRRGADMGPSAIRLAGLKSALAKLGHGSEESHPPISVPAAEYLDEGDSRAKYLRPIAEACAELAARTKAAVGAGEFPLILGGDHSIAVGTLSGLGAAYRERGIRWGALWIDAHGDFNTPATTPSGNIHGMSLAVACGLGLPELTDIGGNFRKLDPANVALLGLRDLDPGEKLLMRGAGVHALTMTDVDRVGIAAATRDVVDFFRERVDALHVSVDMDVMDPSFAPGVGTPLPGGLSYREVLLLSEELAASGLVRSVELVEVNPILDVRNQTARMAVDIIGRLLGETVY